MDAATEATGLLIGSARSKPRLTGVEDISEAKRKMKTTHLALDAV